MLVDSLNNTYADVQMYKDYSDALYITVSVRPVISANGEANPPSGSSQYLHSQPSPPVQFSRLGSPSPLASPSGKVFISDVFDPSLQASYVNQLVLGSRYVTATYHWRMTLTLGLTGLL